MNIASYAPLWDVPGAVVKNLPDNADERDMGLIAGSRRSPEIGNDNPF